MTAAPRPASAQTKSPAKTLIGVIGAAAALIVTPFVSCWESGGTPRLVAYQDIVKVWTICGGETLGVQKSQSDRIGRQKAPDGSAFAPRRDKRELKPGTYAVKFLYLKGDANPRKVLMKSWVHDGPLMTGFDAEAGGIRSFFYDKVAKYLPVEAAEQNSGAGKLRRRGTIRQKAMFRKLRNGRNLRAGSTDQEAWIGFSGRAAEIARVHQEGLREKPSLEGRAVRYARRGLLGLTQAEQSRALDMLLEHVTPA